MDLENLKNTITNIKEVAEKIKPMIEEKERLEKIAEDLYDTIEIMKKDAEERLLSQVKIPSLLFSINDLKSSILDTIKNSLKTKTGRVIIETTKRNNDVWGIEKIGLTQKHFSFLYNYQHQIKDDGDIDILYYAPSSETFEIKDKRDVIECSFPKSALTDLKIIDKEYVDKFCEFLIEYEKLKVDDSRTISIYDRYDRDGIDLCIYDKWNWEEKQYKKEVNLNVDWNKVNNISPEIIEEININVEKIIDRNKQLIELYNKVKEFNAGRNLLRELRK